MTENTYGTCPHCKKGNVVGTVKHVPLHDSSNMPYGPVSEINYRLETSFWCSECGVTFMFPPGNKKAVEELLTKERKRIAEVQQNW